MFVKNLINKNMETKISFLVTGNVTQDILIVDSNETAENVVSKLESGEYCTTLHGNHPIITESITGKVIAYITNMDNECEYYNFVIEND